MSDSTSTTITTAQVTNPFAAVGRAVMSAVRFVRREREIARAERHLAAMSDDMLRDIGIRRDEIGSMVRFGRRDYARYL